MTIYMVLHNVYTYLELIFDVIIFIWIGRRELDWVRGLHRNTTFSFGIINPSLKFYVASLSPFRSPWVSHYPILSPFWVWSVPNRCHTVVQLRSTVSRKHSLHYQIYDQLNVMWHIFLIFYVLSIHM